MSDGRLHLTRRILPAAIAALVFVSVAALYANGRTETYKAMMEWWGVDAFSSPFVDIETVLSAVRCLGRGVDVFATNPCDPVRRVYDYSPLWLLLVKLPVTEAWTTPAGLVVDLSFIASLILLPAGRGIVATVLITLGVLSSAVVFGMERGNNDLVLFVLAAAAAALVCRRDSLRFVGYALAFLAGLLKYYPMTLMMMATRERPARFFAIAAASLALVALFFATMGHELSRALKLIPAGGWFGDMFGSTTLPGGLGREYGWPAGPTAALRWGLMIAAFGAGTALAMRQRIGAAVERLTDHERMALLAGGLLMLSCFFTAQNIGYRAMHLVLTLPALTALVRMRAGRVWVVTTGTVLALLWGQAWRNWYFPQEAGRRPLFIRGWMLRELLWWWTISMLIALVFAIIVRSEMGRRVLGRFAPRSSAEPAAVS
jgi:hypothetical protein